MRLIPWVAALLAGVAPGIGQSVPNPCDTAASCVERLRESNQSSRHAVIDKLATLGDAAVVALLPLLDDPSPDVRHNAAVTLSQIDAIDPRHAPALIAAYRAGNHALARALGSTRTDAALAVLRAEPLRLPNENANEGVQIGLARFGDRLRPWLLAELEPCRRSKDVEHCTGIAQVIGEMHPFPAWALPAMAAVARAPHVHERIGALMERYLISQRDPAGLAALMRDLARTLERKDFSGNSAVYTIGDVGRFGPAGAPAGPLVASFLARADMPDARAEAARTVGLIGYRPAIAGLAATADAFPNDWVLAYNAVESLALLGAEDRRALVARAARDHWHPAVRANADRALNRLAGGAFERPGVTGDAAPYVVRDEQGRQVYDRSNFRYAGDAAPRWCTRADGHGPALYAAEVTAPAEGSQFLRPAPVSAEQERAFLRLHENFGANAKLSVALPWNDGWILGFDEGEWGGGLVFRSHGRTKGLIGDNPRAAFAWGGRLYALTGLRHLGLDSGTLWELDPTDLHVVRRVRLPSMPDMLAVSSKGAVIVRTGSGDLAIGLDGRLLDPGPFSDC